MLLLILTVILIWLMISDLEGERKHKKVEQDKAIKRHYPANGANKSKTYSGYTNRSSNHNRDDHWDRIGDEIDYDQGYYDHDDYDNFDDVS